MAQTVLITLTTAGADTGPFDLYSNVDGYLVPFETGISKAALEAGYTSVLVPDGAVSIRVQSDNEFCTNYVDLDILPNTTTTTSTSTSTSTTTSTTSTTTTAIPEGIFELDTPYGLQIDDVIGTGVPAFSYPVEPYESLPYTGTVSAQTFEVVMSGTRVAPITYNISLIIDDVTVEDCSNITTDGSQSHFLTLSAPVSAPSTISITVGIGAC